jgi:hypothetical protein
MADYSTIGVGTSANDGTGDNLRSAFTKVNNNNALQTWMQGIFPTADLTGSNVNTAQAVFSTPSQVTLAATTSYEFEGEYHIDTTGTTSHSIALLFGGTATFTSILYSALSSNGATATTTSAASLTRGNVATAITVTAAVAAATQNIIRIRGVMRINGAGTVIPQFQYSAAPGVAPTINKNSFFRCWAIGAASATSFGSDVS